MWFNESFLITGKFLVRFWPLYIGLERKRGITHRFIGQGVWWLRRTRCVVKPEWPLEDCLQLCPHRLLSGYRWSTLTSQPLAAPSHINISQLSPSRVKDPTRFYCLREIERLCVHKLSKVKWKRCAVTAALWVPLDGKIPPNYVSSFKNSFFKLAKSHWGVFIAMFFKTYNEQQKGLNTDEKAACSKCN